MTETVSVPQTAQVDTPKKTGGWEMFFRCLVLLLGLFLGLVVAVVIAAATGWFTIDC